MDPSRLSDIFPHISGCVRTPGAAYNRLAHCRARELRAVRTRKVAADCTCNLPPTHLHPRRMTPTQATHKHEQSNTTVQNLTTELRLIDGAPVPPTATPTRSCTTAGLAMTNERGAPLFHLPFSLARQTQTYPDREGVTG